MRIMTRQTLIVAGTAMLLSGTAFAQASPSGPSQPETRASQQIDDRWLPWLGCWQSIVDPGAVEHDTRVCVLPGANGVSARLVTLSGDKTEFEETIVPDAADRSITDAGCRGTRRAEWSESGGMLFTRGRMTCGSRPAEELSGIHLLSRQQLWLDIRVAASGPRTAVDVQRYGRATVPDSLRAGLPDALLAQALAAADRLTAIPLSAADVIDAQTHSSPRAVESALYETNARFSLNSRSLIALDDAGVEDEVIDLMLALSYPERFAVERSFKSAGPAFANNEPPVHLAWGWTRVYDFDVFGDPDPSLTYAYYDAYGHPYYVDAYGRSYYDVTRQRDDASTRRHLQNPDEPGTAPGSSRATGSSGGAVVKGQGYTRVPPAGRSDSTNDGNNSGAKPGNESPAPSDSARNSPSETHPSTDSSSQKPADSGASGAGYTAGSSSGGTGRTAVERE